MGQQQDRSKTRGSFFDYTGHCSLQTQIINEFKGGIEKTNIQTTSLKSVCSHMFNANSQKHTKDPTWSLNVNEDAPECAYVCQPT